ncbi:MAG TPA: cytidylate kinase family protein [Aggregatilineales bacterium]|nr:cytidylate kinase family protein [Aggregatilineales bacterium]
MDTRVITITGEVASGKSTIAKALLDLLPGWTQANTGGKFREICDSRGISIQEVSFLDDDIHREVDNWQRQIALTRSNLIIEGRLAGWLTRDLAHVLRVYCYAQPAVRIQRYIQREGKSEEEAKSDIEYRDSRDMLKFQRMYEIDDYRDPAYYSFILDTSFDTPEVLAHAIMEKAGLAPKVPTRR